MKITWMHILACVALIQSIGTQTIWKQIDTSPFSIKSDPSSDQEGPRQLAYSPNGSFLALANAFTNFLGSGSVSIFSVNKLTGTLAELQDSPFATQGRQTLGLAFSPHGPSTLTAVNNFGTPVVFDFNSTTGVLDNLRPLNNSPECPSNIKPNSITYTPQGKYAAATDNTPSNLSIYQVNQTTGNLTCQQEVTTLLLDPRSSTYYPLPLTQSYLVVANHFDPDNDIVIFTANPDTGIISNPKSFSLRNGQEIAPHWVTFSPNGSFLAVAVEDGVEVRKFRATGINAPTLLPLNNSISFFPTPSSTPTPGFSGVRSVAYSPDGRWLAAANANETVSVFCVDQETGALFNRQDLVVGHTGNLEPTDFTFSVIFSPDSKFLAISNRNDNSISVFTNPSAGRPTCNTMLNLSNNSACTASTQESSVESKI